MTDINKLSPHMLRVWDVINNSTGIGSESIGLNLDISTMSASQAAGRLKKMNLIKSVINTGKKGKNNIYYPKMLEIGSLEKVETKTVRAARRAVELMTDAG